MCYNGGTPSPAPSGRAALYQERVRTRRRVGRAVGARCGPRSSLTPSRVSAVRTKILSSQFCKYRGIIWWIYVLCGFLGGCKDITLHIHCHNMSLCIHHNHPLSHIPWGRRYERRGPSPQCARRGVPREELFCFFFWCLFQFIRFWLWHFYFITI